VLFKKSFLEGIQQLYLTVIRQKAGRVMEIKGGL